MGLPAEWSDHRVGADKIIEELGWYYKTKGSLSITQVNKINQNSLLSELSTSIFFPLEWK